MNGVQVNGDSLVTRVVTGTEESSDRYPPANTSYTYGEYGDGQLLSNLSLLQMSNGKQYAFSNRLVEYLVWNVICSTDDIDKNIERVQDYISNNKIVQYNGGSYRMSEAPQLYPYTDTYTKGVWKDMMRKYLFDIGYFSKVLPIRLDLNGYVDKDIEQLVTRG